MTKTLREFITTIDGMVVPIFNATGIFYPLYHAVTASGEHRIVKPPSMDKDVSALLMRAYFELQNVVRYVFIDEAWQLYRPDSQVSEAELRHAMEHGLKDHPDRVEVLMYQAEDATEPVITAHRVITRPAHGKARLGPLEFFTPTQSEGRLTGMLPQRGTMQ